MIKIPKSKFIYYVGTLLTGNIISQFITYSSVPIITRLYTPKDFGVFAIFTAFVGLFMKFSSLSYSQAVLLPKTNKEAFQLVLLSSIIILIFSFFLFFMFINKNWIENFFHIRTQLFWFYFVPLCVGLYGYNNLLTNWHIKNKKFKTVGLANVIGAISSIAIKILVGIYIGSCVGGLIGGFLAGIIASLIFLGLKANFNNKIKSIRNFKYNIKGLISSAKKYKKFPLFVTLAQVLNIFSEKIIVFILAFYFQKFVIGNYNLAIRTVSNPINLLSNAIQKVYFQKLAEQSSHNLPIIPKLKRLIKFLMIIGFLPFLIIFLWGKAIFIFIFGEQWKIAGVYAQIIIFYLYIRFITNPTRLIFYVKHRQEVLFFFNLITLLASTIALVSGSIIYKSAKGALICFVCVRIITELLICFLAFQEVEK